MPTDKESERGAIEWISDGLEFILWIGAAMRDPFGCLLGLVVTIGAMFCFGRSLSRRTASVGMGWAA